MAKKAYIGVPQYTELSYIESSGTQYIDTGVIGKSGIEIYLDYEYTELSSTAQIVIGSSTSSVRCYPVSSAGYIGYGDYYDLSMTLAANTSYNMYAKMYDGEQIVTLNGETAYSGTTSGEINSGYSMALFAANWAGTVKYFAKAKLRSCKIIENGVLVRDFVPCRLASGVVGMYDRVSKTFFSNAGTGAFIGGTIVGAIEEEYTSRKLPAGYKQMAYIRSTGTQYIDTGFMPNQNTRVVVDVQFNEIPTSHSAVFGAYDSTNAYWAYYRYSDKQYRAINGGSTQYSISYTDPTVKTILDLKKGAFVVGENEVALTETEFSIALNIYLFAQNRNGTMYYPASCKMYSCQIYDNGSLARDFVPCRNTSGEAGMYDLVSGTFFGNNGTGKFIGSDESFARQIKKIYIGIPQYTELSYIESTGTQYIDTGIAVTDGYEVYLDYEYTAITQAGQTIFGAMANSNRHYPLNISSNGYGVGYWEHIAIDTTILANTSYQMHAKMQPGEQSVTINGQTIYSGTDSRTPGLSYNLYLFTANLHNNSTSNLSTAKVRNCKILVGGVIKRDYIPCRTMDGSVGMYDRVSNAFFENKGTGTFVAGGIIGAIDIESSTNQSVAHRVKKAYIGIGGVARPCFGGGELEYYGEITQLSSARRNHSATTIGNYAIFAGGRPDSNLSSYLSTVDVYDDKLVRTSPSNGLITARYGLTSTTVGNYAIFAGGCETAYVTTVDAYNTSLTRTIKYLSKARSGASATSVGNYAIFGTGTQNATMYNVVDAFDTSLTRTTPTTYSNSRVEASATTVGEHALFAGGEYHASVSSSNASRSTVDVYDASLTRTTTTALSVARTCSSTTVGNYALFAGGSFVSSSNNKYSATVDAYDISLTRISITDLSLARSEIGAVTLGEYALFCGGFCYISNVGSSYVADVDVYDTSLTRTIFTPLSMARSPEATSVGEYALLGGGSYKSGSTTYGTSKMEAYTCERPEITVNLVVLKTVGNTIYSTERQTISLKAKVGMKYSDLALTDTNTVEIPGSNGNTLTILLSNGCPAYKITTSSGKSLTIYASDGGAYVSTALTDGMTIDFGSTFSMADYDLNDWTFV